MCTLSPLLRLVHVSSKSVLLRGLEYLMRPVWLQEHKETSHLRREGRAKAPVGHPPVLILLLMAEDPPRPWAAKAPSGGTPFILRPAEQCSARPYWSCKAPDGSGKATG